MAKRRTNVTKRTGTVKTTPVQTPVEAKTEPVKTSTKESAADVKTAEVKTVETKVPETKAPETKAPETKAAEKKPAAKKPAAKKPAAKKEMKVKAIVEYYGKQVEEKDMIANVKKAWTKSGKKVGDIKTMELYIKPEENAVYYVINGTETGAVAF